ncbi:MAG: hypothetical protein ACE5NJ_05985 [Thermodesulfobacteriota bacterium]
MIQKNDEAYGVPYGYRARVGLIVVGPNLNPTPEIARMMPPYVQIRETRIHMEPVVNVDECSKLSSRLPEPAGLLAEGMVSPILGNNSAIAFACTAGSLIGGPGWDKKEIEAMESNSNGIPCTTTATAAEEAMRFMDLEKIVIAGPYIEEVNERFREFYEHSGFQVLNIKGLQIEDLYEMGATKPSQAYQIAMDTLVPDADGIFIVCTNFRCSDVIEEIENDSGKPVVTANQATAWHLLKLLDINAPVEGYGQLLRKVPRTD